MPLARLPARPTEGNVFLALSTVGAFTPSVVGPAGSSRPTVLPRSRPETPRQRFPLLQWMPRAHRALGSCPDSLCLRQSVYPCSLRCTRVVRPGAKTVSARREEQLWEE